MLNDCEKKLVEDNLGLIPKIIGRCISVNENILGLGYEDLYQDACVALCKAAVTYNGTASFPTYAGTVVRNYLISQCRAATTRYSHESPPDDWEKWQAALEGIPDPEKTGWKLRELLSQIEDCTPGEKLGIEALLWRARGYSCGEIGNLYGITGKLASKRIAQAKKKLKKDPELLRALH